MKWTGLLVMAVFCLSHTVAEGQVSSMVVGSPQACRNEANDIEINYTVENHFKNRLQDPLVIKIGTDNKLSFFLFKGKETTNPGDAIQWANADPVGPLPTRRQTLRPGESMEWTKVATVFTRDWDPSSNVPQPGDYFIWPFADIEVMKRGAPVPEDVTKGSWIPIRIPRLGPDLQACHRAPAHRAASR